MPAFVSALPTTCLAACLAAFIAAPGGTAIHALQGAGAQSSLDGQPVLDVRGIVTSVQGRGFTLQSPPGAEDDDPATSEGLLVLRVDAGTDADMPGLGDLLSVTGTLHERRGAKRTNDLTVTTLEAREWTRLAADQPLPSAVLLGPGGLPLPSDVAAACALFESLEGMRVELRAAVVVDPTSKSGELVVVADAARVAAPGAGGRGVLPQVGEPGNGDRLLLDDLLAPMPEAQTGDRLAAPLIGVLGYSWGRYCIHPLAAPTFESGGLRPEVAQAPPDGALTVASYNVENLAGTTQRARFAALAGQIVEALRAPAIVALQEIQDDSGRKDDGTVSATLTLRKLTDAIVAAGGPRYRAFDAPPQDGADGGEPGGNIRVAFLVREGDDLRVTGPPERVAPEQPTWTSARKPLALRVAWRGRPLLLVANHWSSRIGDDASFGARQPPRRPSAERHVDQAAAVADFIDAALQAEPELGVLVLGDFNDVESSPGLARLEGDRLRLECLTRDVPVERRHTYIHEGDAQALDHVLISPRLRRSASSLRYGPVHLNAEFSKPVSDHDPVLLTLELPAQ